MPACGPCGNKGGGKKGGGGHKGSSRSSDNAGKTRNQEAKTKIIDKKAAQKQQDDADKEFRPKVAARKARVAAQKELKQEQEAKAREYIEKLKGTLPRKWRQCDNSDSDESDEDEDSIPEAWSWSERSFPEAKRVVGDEDAEDEAQQQQPSIHEARQTFQRYDDRWSALPAEASDVPYPSDDFTLTSLRDRSTIIAYHPEHLVKKWSNDQIMRTNASIFFLRGHGIEPQLKSSGLRSRLTLMPMMERSLS